MGILTGDAIKKITEIIHEGEDQQEFNIILNNESDSKQAIDLTVNFNKKAGWFRLAAKNHNESDDLRSIYQKIAEELNENFDLDKEAHVTVDENEIKIGSDAIAEIKKISNKNDDLSITSFPPYVPVDQKKTSADDAQSITFFSPHSSDEEPQVEDKTESVVTASEQSDSFEKPDNEDHIENSSYINNDAEKEYNDDIDNVSHMDDAGYVFDVDNADNVSGENHLGDDVDKNEDDNTGNVVDQDNANDIFGKDDESHVINIDNASAEDDSDDTLDIDEDNNDSKVDNVSNAADGNNVNDISDEDDANDVVNADILNSADSFYNDNDSGNTFDINEDSNDSKVDNISSITDENNVNDISEKDGTSNVSNADILNSADSFYNDNDSGDTFDIDEDSNDSKVDNISNITDENNVNDISEKDGTSNVSNADVLNSADSFYKDSGDTFDIDEDNNDSKVDNISNITDKNNVNNISEKNGTSNVSNADALNSADSFYNDNDSGGTFDIDQENNDFNVDNASNVADENNIDNVSSKNDSADDLDMVNNDDVSKVGGKSSVDDEDDLDDIFDVDDREDIFNKNDAFAKDNADNPSRNSIAKIKQSLSQKNMASAHAILREQDRQLEKDNQVLNKDEFSKAEVEDVKLIARLAIKDNEDVAPAVESKETASAVELFTDDIIHNISSLANGEVKNLHYITEPSDSLQVVHVTELDGGEKINQVLLECHHLQKNHESSREIQMPLTVGDDLRELQRDVFIASLQGANMDSIELDINSASITAGNFQELLTVIDDAFKNNIEIKLGPNVIKEQSAFAKASKNYVNNNTDMNNQQRSHFIAKLDKLTNTEQKADKSKGSLGRKMAAAKTPPYSKDERLTAPTSSYRSR